MQLILAIWRSAASKCWHNIQTLRSFITVIKPFPTLIIQSLLINEINLYHLFLTKKKRKKIGTGPSIMPARPCIGASCNCKHVLPPFLFISRWIVQNLHYPATNKKKRRVYIDISSLIFPPNCILVMILVAACFFHLVYSFVCPSTIFSLY
jgi:hypothetical protein